MAATTRSPQEMALVMRRMASFLLAGSVVLVVAGVVLLLVNDNPVIGVALIVIGVLDVALALVVRGQARRTNPANQELS